MLRTYSTVIIVWFLCYLTSLSIDASPSHTFRAVHRPRERSLTPITPREKARVLIDHFKGDNPLGIPLIPIPDPLDVPDIEAQLKLTEAQLRGLSLFSIKNFTVQQSNDNTIRIFSNVVLTNLQLTAMYQYSTWFTTYEGKFQMNITEAEFIGIVKLDVDQNGFLQITDNTVDLTYKNMKLDLENGGVLLSMLSAAINTIGGLIFNAIKPVILGPVSNEGIPKINALLKKQNLTFPNSIPVVDSAFAKMKLEKVPKDLPLEDITVGSYESVQLKLTDGHVTGLQTIHRSGPLSIEYSNHTIHLTLQVQAGRLAGSYKWNLPLYFYEQSGMMSFTVEGADIFVRLSRPMNIDLPTTIEDLDIELGAVSMIFNGGWYLDYVVQFVANVVPNLLRGVIMDAVEYVIQSYAQRYLDELDLERIIFENLKDD